VSEEAPAALLGGPVWELWWTIVFTALAAFALVVTLASSPGRLIARSVGQAAQGPTTLGEGSPLPPDEAAVAEVGTLMVELRRAAARRQVAEQDLQASNDQLQAGKDRRQIALNAANLGWWQYDSLRGTGSGDARANEIHDFDIAEDEEVALEGLLKQVASGRRWWG
jgi:hypothetical protein